MDPELEHGDHCQFEVAQINLASNYSLTAMTALACYECVLTLPHEVRLVWGREAWTEQFYKSYHINSTIQFWSLWYLSSILAGLCPLLTASLFSGLRVYALMSRYRRLMGALVFLLGFSGFAYIYIDLIAVSRGTTDPLFNPLHSSLCEFGFGVERFIGLVPALAADLIVILVTWIKTFEPMRDAHHLGLRTLGLILFRDGSIYFIAFSALDIMQIYENYAHWGEADSRPAATTSYVLGAVVGMLQPILISRFLINLREAAGATEASLNSADSRHFAEFSEPGFRVPTFLDTISGNMGADLAHGYESEPNFEDLDGAT